MRILAALAFAFTLSGQISCPCDPQQPETLKERQCALCAVAEKQPAGTLAFVIEDNNPRKPDRWLALPKMHSPGIHQMDLLPLEVRTELWKDAIAKAKELWGDQWGVAYNAEILHTQCHVHVHIGKLIDGVEWGEFKVVNGPEEIPMPGKNGLWIHPVAGKLHVHLGELGTENVLMR